MTITLELPWPDPVLWPNRSNGRHWSVRQRAKEQAGNDGFWAVVEKCGRQTLPECDVPVTYTGCPPSGSRRDMDGLLAAMKPYQDGIARALGIDDRFFNPIVVKRGVKVPGGRVVVEIGA